MNCGNKNGTAGKNNSVAFSCHEWSHLQYTVSISSTDSKVRTILYSIINSITGMYCSIAFICIGHTLGFHPQTQQLEPCVCVVPENIHTPTTEGHLKFQAGGALKGQIFKGKYELKLEFPEGWGVQTKKSLHGGSMDIFSNNTMKSTTEKCCSVTFICTKSSIVPKFYATH